MLHGAWTWEGQNGYPTGYPLVYRTARGYWQAHPRARQTVPVGRLWGVDLYSPGRLVGCCCRRVGRPKVKVERLLARILVCTLGGPFEKGGGQCFKFSGSLFLGGGTFVAWGNVRQRLRHRALLGEIKVVGAFELHASSRASCFIVSSTSSTPSSSAFWLWQPCTLLLHVCADTYRAS